MSIATLKKNLSRRQSARRSDLRCRKQRVFAERLSSQHWRVGQFRMVSNVTRTLFRGNTPVGWGGCCGTYPQYIANSGNCCTNDSSIVKLSTKNTKGMLDEKYLGILHGAYPNTWVKDDDNSYRITDTQSQYIESLTWKAGSCKFQADKSGNTTVADAEACKCSQGKFYHIGGKNTCFINQRQNLLEVTHRKVSTLQPAELQKQRFTNTAVRKTVSIFIVSQRL